MPYVRFLVGDERAALLLKMAQAEEDEQARDENRKPRKVNLTDAVWGCFIEGMEDMQARQSD